MLLMVTLATAGTWNPPMEETKTAEPPPRDSKRGTQAWELARKMKRKMRVGMATVMWMMVMVKYPPPGGTQAYQIGGGG